VKIGDEIDVGIEIDLIRQDVTAGKGLVVIGQVVLQR
jgi:hypothetical protein